MTNRRCKGHEGIHNILWKYKVYKIKKTKSFLISALNGVQNLPFLPQELSNENLNIWLQSKPENISCISIFWMILKNHSWRRNRNGDSMNTIKAHAHEDTDHWAHDKSSFSYLFCMITWLSWSKSNHTSPLKSPTPKDSPPLTNVLAGKPHKPPGHVEWVLPSLQHPCQPVQGGVLVRATHSLVQGRDAVVVLFSCTERESTVTWLPCVPTWPTKQTQTGPRYAGEGRHDSCPPAIFSEVKPGLMSPRGAHSGSHDCFLARSCSEEKLLMTAHTGDTQIQLAKGREKTGIVKSGLYHRGLPETREVREKLSHGSIFCPHSLFE